MEEKEDILQETEQLSDGVWLIEHDTGFKSYTKIAKLGEIPDPFPLASLFKYEDEMIAAIRDCIISFDEYTYPPYIARDIFKKFIEEIMGEKNYKRYEKLNAK